MLFFFALRERINAQCTLSVIGRVDRRILADNPLLHVVCFGKSKRVPKAGHIFIVRRPHVHIDSRHHRKDVCLGSLRSRFVRFCDPEIRPAVIERPVVPRHFIHIDLVDLPLVPFVEAFLHALFYLRPSVVYHQHLFRCFVKRQSPDFTDHLNVVERSLQSDTGIRAVRVHPPAVDVVRFSQISRAVICCHIQVSFIIGDPPQPLRGSLHVYFADVFAGLQTVAVQIPPALVAGP